MKENTIKQINRTAKKLGFLGIVTAENAQEIVKELITNHSAKFTAEIDRIIERSGKEWEWSTTTQHNETFKENYEIFTDLVEEILSLVEIRLDWPGLYPTYFVKYDGKEYNEYTTQNAFKRFNGFWK